MTEPAQKSEGAEEPREPHHQLRCFWVRPGLVTTRIAERVAAYREAGCDEVVLYPADVDASEVERRLAAWIPTR